VVIRSERRLSLKKGVELDLLSPDLLDFDLEKLSAAIQPERSNHFFILLIECKTHRHTHEE
jgi:ribonucleoside-diphosphate reductase alpha chain